MSNSKKMAEIAAIDSAQADTLGEIRDCIQESVDKYFAGVEWQPIKTAPKNAPGESFGPWILVFHGYDYSVYQARWECHGHTRGWVAKNNPNSFSTHHVNHWMSLPSRPEATTRPEAV